MNTEITFTPAQLIAWVLAVCGGISCIAAAINWIAKAVKASGGYLSCIVCIK